MSPDLPALPAERRNSRSFIEYRSITDGKNAITDPDDLALIRDYATRLIKGTLNEIASETLEASLLPGSKFSAVVDRHRSEVGDPGRGSLRRSRDVPGERWRRHTAARGGLPPSSTNPARTRTS